MSIIGGQAVEQSQCTSDDIIANVRVGFTCVKYQMIKVPCLTGLHVWATADTGYGHRSKNKDVYYAPNSNKTGVCITGAYTKTVDRATLMT